MLYGLKEKFIGCETPPGLRSKSSPSFAAIGAAGSPVIQKDLDPRVASSRGPIAQRPK
jgi:hypothetical protein